VQSGLEGELSHALRDVLDFLGLEWMVGTSVSKPAHLWHTPLNESLRKASDAVDLPLGLLHELRTRDDAHVPGLESSHPDSSGSLWFSVEDLAVQQREWHLQAVSIGLGDCGHQTSRGAASEPLRRIGKHERLIFDFGARNALRPREIVLLIGTSKGNNADSVKLHLAALSDFEVHATTLVRGSFALVGQDYHLLRIEMPEPRRHFFRMFALRLAFTDDTDTSSSGCWTLARAEFFGEFLQALPRSIFPKDPREPFEFDAASESCKIITQI